MIRIDRISKSFGTLRVLQDISFDIPTGEVTAIIGHNGSGKTTLLKIVLGLVRCDEGAVWLDDFKLNGDHTFRARIGYMPQDAQFPDHLTVSELFALILDLRNNPETVDRELVKAFALEAELSKKVSTLSGGTRQKVSAAICFMFRPDVLILDEPTAGLDPVASSVVKKKIRSARDRGATVILTSHIASEIDELSDSVVFMNEGQIAFRGAPDHLKEVTGASTLENAVAAMMLEDRESDQSWEKDIAAGARTVGENVAT